ncbi:tyrosine-type recombinase/integrase [Litorimonas sp.]|uniref:tyrosine-type recombinase/integrase n=1 Tax=Litorimonas sp. TaxID=1892381 RepID=UPI003A8B4108
MPERLSNTYPEKDRHGKIRWRFRKKGYASAQLPGEPGSPEFLAAWLKAMGKPSQAAKPRHVKSGSMRSLINDYITDPTFKQNRDEGTQIAYKKRYDAFCDSTGKSGRRRGDMPFASADSIVLRKIIREEQGRSITAARRLHTALSAVFEYAVESEQMRLNPMKSVSRPKAKKTEGFHTWTDEEIGHYRDSYEIGTNERLAFELLLYTGLRGANLFDLGWQNVRNGYLRVKPVKGGDWLELFITPDFAEVLEPTRGNMTFIICQSGTHYTRKSFQQWFSKSATLIGLPHCSAHGLRKARGRLMAEHNCTDRQIMAVLGHKTSAMATKYTRAANQKRLAEQAYGKTEFPNLQNTMKAK